MTVKVLRTEGLSRPAHIPTVPGSDFVVRRDARIPRRDKADRMENQTENDSV